MCSYHAVLLEIYHLATGRLRESDESVGSRQLAATSLALLGSALFDWAVRQLADQASTISRVRHRCGRQRRVATILSARCAQGRSGLLGLDKLVFRSTWRQWYPCESRNANKGLLHSSSGGSQHRGLSGLLLRNAIDRCRYASGIRHDRVLPSPDSSNPAQ